jgi:hypothetical protein
VRVCVVSGAACAVFGERGGDGRLGTHSSSCSGTMRPSLRSTAAASEERDAGFFFTSHVAGWSRRMLQGLVPASAARAVDAGGYHAAAGPVVGVPSSCGTMCSRRRGGRRRAFSSSSFGG